MATDYLSILSDQLEELRQTTWESIITRKEEQEVNLNSPLAQVVIGVRRSGKSTLCTKVMMESKLPFGYINFDDDRLGKLTRDDFDPLLQHSIVSMAILSTCFLTRCRILKAGSCSSTECFDKECALSLPVATLTC